MNWSEEEYQRHLERQKNKPAVGTTKKPSGSKTGLQALGRLPKGTMNKSETAYAQRLEMQKHAGEVLWYKFEGIRLMLAANTSITVDFAVLPASGVLEMIDVKGSKAIFTDDARAKMKVAAAMYPFVFKVAYPLPQKDGGGWNIEVI